MLCDHIFQFGHSHQKLTFLASEQSCELWWYKWPGVVAPHGNRLLHISNLALLLRSIGQSIYPDIKLSYSASPLSHLLQQLFFFGAPPAITNILKLAGRVVMIIKHKQIGLMCAGV